VEVDPLIEVDVNFDLTIPCEHSGHWKHEDQPAKYLIRVNHSPCMNKLMWVCESGYNLCAYMQCFMCNDKHIKRSDVWTIVKVI
jgi:hypothetical protein